jgi:hypothetical protein
MLVGVRESGLVGRKPDSEVNQLTRATGEPVADIAQRIRVRELTKQHGDPWARQLNPFRRPCSVVLFHQSRELKNRKVLQQLIEQAHCLYHRFAFLLGFGCRNSSAKRWFGPEQL